MLELGHNKCFADTELNAWVETQQVVPDTEVNAYVGKQQMFSRY